MAPTADDIEQFQMITQASEPEARRELERHATVEAAVNAWFDPTAANAATSQPWDDGVWTGTREHGPENDPQNAFSIDAGAAYQGAMFKPAGLSRPPSRASEAGSTTVQNDEDPSQHQFPIVMDPSSGQETGVTDAYGNPHFQRVDDSTNDYGNNWAVVPHMTQEIFPTPSAENRKRTLGAPAFIKPAGGQSHLPALLTILHAIPRAKEALLARDTLLPDYGYSAEWWKGRSIGSPSHVILDGEDESMLDSTVVYEAQRMMAFLELTERAYGNSEVLGPSITREAPEKQAIKFLDTWRETVDALNPNYELSAAFRTRYTCADPATGTAADASEFSVVELPGVDPQGDLYSTMDRALWAASNCEDPNLPYLEFSDILVIRLEAGNGGGHGSVASVVDIDIPLDFYADRYQKESVEVARDAQMKISKLQTDVKRIADKQAKMSQVQRPAAGSGPIDAVQLLEAVQPYLAQVDAEEDTPKASGEKSDSLSNGVWADHVELLEIAKELQAVADRVKAKYQAFEDEKERACQQMRELNKFYTEASNDPEQPPHNRYILRGLSADPSTTFVYANSRSPDDLMGTDASDWGWWRLAYEPGETQPASCREVTEDYVHNAGRNKHPSVLLVYAREKALDDQETNPLPSALRNFVRTDNLAFVGELDNQTSMHATPTSAKRKAEEPYDDDAEPDDPNWGGGGTGWHNSPSRTADGAGTTNRVSNDIDAGIVPMLVDVDSAPPQPSGPPPAPPPYYHSKPVPPAPPPRPPPPPRKAVQRQQQQQDQQDQTDQTEHQPASGAKPPAVPPRNGALPVDGAAADPFQDVDLTAGDAAGGEMQERSGRTSEILGGAGAGAGTPEKGGPYANEIAMPDLEEMEHEGAPARSGNVAG